MNTGYTIHLHIHDRMFIQNNGNHLKLHAGATIHKTTDLNNGGPFLISKFQL